MIVIIDYNMGNTMSVKNSVFALGYDVLISRDPNEIEKATHIILPGVGAFKDGMANLRNYGLVDILKKEVLEEKKPFLGICIGLQMLASKGEEGGTFEGLGFVPGLTRRFIVDEKKFRIPHIGWNDVEILRPDLLFEKVRQPIFYFDHSYHLVPNDRSVVIAETDYGERFAAAIRSGNICGTQFHPEKSQHAGMKLLGNFLEM